MKNNELKIVVPGCRVVDAKVMSDGSCVLMLESATSDDTICHQRQTIFKKVPASELSLKDKFMNYNPKTNKERMFMEEVKKVIEKGVRDFWRPVYDPSFDDNGHIRYVLGKKPAVGKSYSWWEEKAKDFYPERGSRLGTKFEYIAFLAVLIKELVHSGKSVEWAWNAVCNDSEELGHYYNSPGAKGKFEPTGSREICGWYDLLNTFKILSEDEEVGGFWIAGGYYNSRSHADPLQCQQLKKNKTRSNSSNRFISCFLNLKMSAISLYLIKT